MSIPAQLHVQDRYRGAEAT